MRVRNHAFGDESSGQQAELLAELDGLGAAAGTEFLEGTAAMGLDGVLADEKSVGDLAIAEALGDEVKDLKLAAGGQVKDSAA